ncbi:uncharacterized protein LOC144445917 [Glandiceps talaboti]
MITAIFPFIVAGISSSLPPYEYVGCFADTDQRALGWWDEKYTAQTVERCIGMCASIYAPYAGLQHHEECFCGVAYDKYGEINEAECSTACNGNSSQMCGGNWRMSVYRIHVHMPDLPLYKYVGCFIDGGDRALSWYSDNSPVQSVEWCILKCSEVGAPYAGLEATAECFCGLHHDMYGETLESDCYEACTGNKQQKCGADDAGFFTRRVTSTPALGLTSNWSSSVQPTILQCAFKCLEHSCNAFYYPGDTSTQCHVRVRNSTDVTTTNVFTEQAMFDADYL